MKFILKVNNMYVRYMSIDSYDETVSCEFSSDIRDAKEFSESNVLIVKPIIEKLLTIELEAIAKKGGESDDQNN